MSTRYVRKEVPLEVRGISRASVEHHPLPERVDGSSTATPTLPFTFVHSMSHAIDSYDSAVKRRQRSRIFAGGPAARRSLGSPSNSSSTPSSNGSSSADGGSTVSVDGPVSTAGSAAVDWIERCRGAGGVGWTAENTTDRTSISSSDWGDDVCEFDRQESRRVRIMFEQIESMLFEASTAGPAHLYRECRHWNSRFPHLRLLGAQLASPQDLGFTYHPMPPEGRALEDSPAAIGGPSATPPELPSPRHPFSSATSDAESMAVVGRHLPTLHPPDDVRSRLQEAKEGEEEEDQSSQFEEIIALDGMYEEVVAVDNKITEEDMTEKKYLKRRRHHGYPPLTPNAVLKDTIVSAVFDNVWAEIVAWMRPLLAENIHRNLIEQQKEDADILPVLPLDPNNLQQFASGRPDGLVSRELSFGRLSRHMPVPAAVGPGDTTLASLLHISTKTLQTRERSSLQDIPESPLAVARMLPPPSQAAPARPNSSLPRSHGANTAQRPGSVRQAGGGTSLEGPSSRLPSARARGRGRLAPLDRTKTPFLEEEALLRGGLRGRSLQPGGDHLVRSGTLPPLSSSSALGTHPTGASRLARISSAVTPAPEKAPPPRPGQLTSQALTVAVAGPPSGATVAVAAVDNRPSTTHTFRSDTPYGRRSSTPLGFRAGVLLNLGIHGNSIGAGSIVHHHLEEGEEGDASRPAHSNNWGSYPPSHSVNNPYRRGKQLGYIVR